MDRLVTFFLITLLFSSATFAYGGIGDDGDVCGFDDDCCGTCPLGTCVGDCENCGGLANGASCSVFAACDGYCNLNTGFCVGTCGSAPAACGINEYMNILDTRYDASGDATIWATDGDVEIQVEWCRGDEAVGQCDVRYRERPEGGSWSAYNGPFITTTCPGDDGTEWYNVNFDPGWCDEYGDCEIELEYHAPSGSSVIDWVIVDVLPNNCADAEEGYSCTACANTWDGSGCSWNGAGWVCSYQHCCPVDKVWHAGTGACVDDNPTCSIVSTGPYAATVDNIEIDLTWLTPHGTCIYNYGDGSTGTNGCQWYTDNNNFYSSSSAGTYTVTLNPLDLSGTNTCGTVTFLEPPEVTCNSAAPIQICDGETATITYSTSTSSEIRPCTITSGDGQSTTVTTCGSAGSQTFTYTTPGTYTMTITDDHYGVTDACTDVVEVLDCNVYCGPPGPRVGVGDSFTIPASAGDPNAQCTIDWGDGTTTTNVCSWFNSQASITHTYTDISHEVTNPSEYTITMSNDHGRSAACGEAAIGLCDPAHCAGYIPPTAPNNFYDDGVCNAGVPFGWGWTQASDLNDACAGNCWCRETPVCDGVRAQSPEEICDGSDFLGLACNTNPYCFDNDGSGGLVCTGSCLTIDPGNCDCDSRRERHPGAAGCTYDGLQCDWRPMQCDITQCSTFYGGAFIDTAVCQASSPPNDASITWDEAYRPGPPEEWIGCGNSDFCYCGTCNAGYEWDPGLGICRRLPYCGDAVVQSPNDDGVFEECDGSAMGSLPNCAAHGYDGGTLNCGAPGGANECQYDISACTCTGERSFDPGTGQCEDPPRTINVYFSSFTGSALVADSPAYVGVYEYLNSVLDSYIEYQLPSSGAWQQCDSDLGLGYTLGTPLTHTINCPVLFTEPGTWTVRARGVILATGAQDDDTRTVSITCPAGENYCAAESSCSVCCVDAHCSGGGVCNTGLDPNECEYPDVTATVSCGAGIVNPGTSVSVSGDYTWTDISLPSTVTAIEYQRPGSGTWTSCRQWSDSSKDGTRSGTCDVVLDETGSWTFRASADNAGHGEYQEASCSILAECPAGYFEFGGACARCNLGSSSACVGDFILHNVDYSGPAATGSCTWNYGTGTNSVDCNNPDRTYSYSEPRTYGLSFTRLGDSLGCGAVDVSCCGGTVWDGTACVAAGLGDPTATLTASPANPTPGVTVTYSVSVSDDAAGMSYTFDRNSDGTPENVFSPGGTSYSTTYTHAWTTPGTYVASLVVTDAGGRTGSASTTVTVGCAGGLFWDGSACVPCTSNTHCSGTDVCISGACVPACNTAECQAINAIYDSATCSGSSPGAEWTNEPSLSAACGANNCYCHAPSVPACSTANCQTIDTAYDGWQCSVGSPGAEWEQQSAFSGTCSGAEECYCHRPTVVSCNTASCQALDPAYDSAKCDFTGGISWVWEASLDSGCSAGQDCYCHLSPACDLANCQTLNPAYSNFQCAGSWPGSGWTHEPAFDAACGANDCYCFETPAPPLACDLANCQTVNPSYISSTCSGTSPGSDWIVETSLSGACAVGTNCYCQLPISCDATGCQGLNPGYSDGICSFSSPGSDWTRESFLDGACAAGQRCYCEFPGTCDFAGCQAQSAVYDNGVCAGSQPAPAAEWIPTPILDIGCGGADQCYCHQAPGCGVSECQAIDPAYEFSSCSGSVPVTPNPEWDHQASLSCPSAFAPLCLCGRCPSGTTYDTTTFSCKESDCSNGLDDDFDGAVDLFDSDCVGSDNPPSIDSFSVTLNPPSGLRPVDVTMAFTLSDENPLQYTVDFGVPGYRWTFFGGATVIDSILETFTTLAPGTYTASLTVVDSPRGQTASASQNWDVTCETGDEFGVPVGSPFSCCDTSCYYNGECYTATDASGQPVCPEGGGGTGSSVICVIEAGQGVIRERDESSLYSVPGGSATCDEGIWIDDGWCEGTVPDSTDQSRCDDATPPDRSFMCGDDPDEYHFSYVHYSDYFASPRTYYACLNDAAGCYGKDSSFGDHHYSGTETCELQTDDNDCDGYIPIYDEDSCWHAMTGNVAVRSSEGYLYNGFFTDVASLPYDIFPMGYFSDVADANGDYDLGLVPFGTYDFSYEFSEAIYFETTVGINAETPPLAVEFDVTLQELECNDDCTNNFGVCDTACIGKNNCFPGQALGDLTADQQEVFLACAPPNTAFAKRPGDTVYLPASGGQRGVATCCFDPIAYEPAPKADIETGDDVENLVKKTKIVTIDGTPVRLIVATWERAE